MCAEASQIHALSLRCRDLKPQNIFMSAGGVIKIGDFGVSSILSATDAFAKTVRSKTSYSCIYSNLHYHQVHDVIRPVQMTSWIAFYEQRNFMVFADAWYSILPLSRNLLK